MIGIGRRGRWRLQMIFNRDTPQQSLPQNHSFGGRGANGSNSLGSVRFGLGRTPAMWSPLPAPPVFFFSIAPPRAVLGDTNRELIEVYDVVRDQPERLYGRLCDISRDLETYRHWRALRPDSLDRETRAVRFVYLNRNCFDGIYRTNAEGQFNVPMGKLTGAYFTKDDLLRCSRLLQHATLVAGDFTETIQHVKAGDFVYLDPPFAVNSRRIFRQYGKKLFETTDVPRLAECLLDIRQKGADFLVSYADCSEARKLASEWNSVRLPVRRNIAGLRRRLRKNAYEWLITNVYL